MRVLLWLRMSMDQIADADQRAGDGAGRYGGRGGLTGYGERSGRGMAATATWTCCGLRDVVGAEGLLSATVPPDRIPSDPDAGRVDLDRANLERRL